MLSIPFNEAFKIYGELIECYHGVNRYGGYVAEIYAYRLYGGNFYLNNSFTPEEEKAEECANNLNFILEMFNDHYPSKISFNVTNESKGTVWHKGKVPPFIHRIHITVAEKK